MTDRRPKRSLAGAGMGDPPGEWTLALPLLVLALTLQTAPAQAAHPFYERLLVQGTLALDRGDFPTAAHDLRIAAFGLLEEPPRLAGALTRLAVAQAARGDDPGFQQTFARILEIEDRFGAYRESDLPEELRKTFEAHVRAKVSASVLALSSSFQRLLEPEAGAASTAKKRSKSSERRQEAQEPPTSVAAVEMPQSPEAPAAEQTLQQPAPISDEERSRVQQAQELLTTAKVASDLREALELIRDVADAHPNSMDLQRLAGEIAYRSSRWSDAAHYFERGGDPGDARPELLFYMAVSFFESGEADQAIAYLQRALPKIERTPFVESYVARILGATAAP